MPYWLERIGLSGWSDKKAVMMLRIAASPDISFWQIPATIFLLGISVAGVMWMAAQVFRTGILMYGKRPGLREIFRWARSR